MREVKYTHLLPVGDETAGASYRIPMGSLRCQMALENPLNIAIYSWENDL